MRYLDVKTFGVFQYIKARSGEKVFDREEQSWHELNPTTVEDEKIYKDSYSAKYLNRVYYPAFKLRVKEKDKPEVKFKCRMLGESVHHKYGKKWIF